MQTFELHIKNMVCPRYINSVRTVLESEGMSVQDVQLGKAVLSSQPDPERMQAISVALQHEGLPLVDDRKQQLVEAIKNIIITSIHHAPLYEMKENFSTLLAGRLHKDYK